MVDVSEPGKKERDRFSARGAAGKGCALATGAEFRFVVIERTATLTR